MLNNFWGDFLEKLKQFLGRESKMDCLFKKETTEETSNHITMRYQKTTARWGFQLAAFVILCTIVSCKFCISQFIQPWSLYFTCFLWLIIYKSPQFIGRFPGLSKIWVGSTFKLMVHSNKSANRPNTSRKYHINIMHLMLMDYSRGALVSVSYENHSQILIIPRNLGQM